jgi:hypothetical protein
MSYNATYNTDDVSEATIDGVVKFVIAIAGFATLIGLVILYGYAKKKGVIKGF